MARGHTVHTLMRRTPRSDMEGREEDDEELVEVEMRFDEEAAGEPDAPGVVGKSLSTCRSIFENIRRILKWGTVGASVMVRCVFCLNLWLPSYGP